MPSWDIRAYEDVFAGDTGCFDALTHFLLIVVHGRRVNMAITRLEGKLHSIFNLVRLRLLSLKSAPDLQT